MTEDELARLYVEHGYSLFRRCTAYLGSASRAQDALQEVFVRALRAAPQFRGEATPRTWLCRIADHLCVDLLRHDRRSPFSSLDSASINLEELLLADDGEALRSVRSLMGSLDASAQRLAVLCFIDELTQDEIAAELSLSRRTVGKRIKALRARARELLEAEGKP
jgi:RNA polymerase sigma-70 factor (ECF subfamily)